MPELFPLAALRQPIRRRRRTFASCRITAADSATTTNFSLLPHHNGRLDDDVRSANQSEAIDLNKGKTDDRNDDWQGQWESGVGMDPVAR